MCILCVCVKINVCLNLSEFQSSWARSSMVAAWMGDPCDTLCYSPASTCLQSETWQHWARSLATLQPLHACRVKHGSTEQDRLLLSSLYRPAEWNMVPLSKIACYSPASTGLQSETWQHWARSLATLQPLQACRVKHGSTEQDRLLLSSLYMPAEWNMVPLSKIACYSPASTGLQSETWQHWARSLATLQPLQACRVKHGSTEQDRLLSKSKLSTIDHGHHTDGWPLHFVPTPASNSVQSLQKSFRWEYMYTKVPPHVYTHKKIPSPMHVKDHVVHVRVRWIMGTIKQHSQWIMGTIK